MHTKRQHHNLHLTTLASACAALALLCDGAYAQSSLTAFGRVEMQASWRDSGTAAVANFPATNERYRLDGLSSRLGFRGTEDLGGGLRAYFVIEHRFKPDTGAQLTPNFWEGQSLVGVSGNWGNVYLGRDYSPAFYPGVRIDPWGYDGSVGSIVGQAWAGYNIGGSSRASNAVGYKSPVWSGVSFHVQTGLGEGARPRTDGANIEYAAGPLYAGVGTTYTDTNNRASIVSAAYDFGVVRPAMWYAVSRYSGNSGRSIALAATAPLAGGTLKAVVQQFDPDRKSGNLNTSAGAGGAVRQKMALGYTYPLSKRTFITPTVAVGKQNISTVSNVKAVDVVLRHDF